MKRLITFAVVLLLPAALFAHAVGLEVKLKGDKVTVEGFFDDDTPADDAKVTLVDEADRVVLEGKTDAKGMWTFDKPNPGKYKIKLDAGAGHRATKTLTIESAQPELTAANSTVQTISDGPTRQEFTSTPWFKIALGLGLIGIVTGLLVLRQRAKKRLLQSTT